MEMNDNTILRIKVPAHLYEAVKAQLTINEAKGKKNLGAGMELVKEKKSSSGDKPKKTSTPKAKSASKKANAPEKATGAMYDKETSKLGAGVSETKKTPKYGHKKLGLEELAKAYEALTKKISQMEGGEEYLKEYNPYWGDFDSRYDRGGRVTDEPGEAAYSRERNLRKNWRYMTPADRTAAMKKEPTTEPGGEEFDEPVKGDKPIYGPEK